MAIPSSSVRDGRVSRWQTKGADWPEPPGRPPSFLFLLQCYPRRRGARVKLDCPPFPTEAAPSLRGGGKKGQRSRTPFALHAHMHARVHPRRPQAVQGRQWRHWAVGSS
jgi:hypothetical protein